MSRLAAKQLVARLDQLGGISDERGRLTRTFLSPAMRRAAAQVGDWMREAGLAVREDSVGNLIGRQEPKDGAGGAKTLLLGSHLDTVPNAGRFDGALGVLLPIAALAELKRRGVQLPFAVEVLGFAEEEGVRFPSAYLGSKGFTGQLRTRDLALRDAGGATVRDVLARWNASTPVKPFHLRSNLLGYIEVHIEQGPVLEAANLAVGIVSAIAGQTRGSLVFRGQAGHAGTTPMHLRRDALTCAAEFIRLVESTARLRGPLVATVGSLTLAPGVPNVIPGEAKLSLDIRHPRDAARTSGLEFLLREAAAIARRRRLQFTWQQTQDNGAVLCAAELSAVLDQSVQRVQGRSPQLISGAGHDAVIMAALMPVAMLFVRCRDGLSHHPDEYASPGDIEVALRVMVDFLEHVGHRGRDTASDTASTHAGGLLTSAGRRRLSKK